MKNLLKFAIIICCIQTLPSYVVNIVTILNNAGLSARTGEANSAALPFQTYQYVFSETDGSTANLISKDKKSIVCDNLWTFKAGDIFYVEITSDSGKVAWDFKITSIPSTTTGINGLDNMPELDVNFTRRYSTNEATQAQINTLGSLSNWSPNSGFVIDDTYLLWGEIDNTWTMPDTYTGNKWFPASTPAPGLPTIPAGYVTMTRPSTVSVADWQIGRRMKNTTSAITLMFGALYKGNNIVTRVVKLN